MNNLIKQLSRILLIVAVILVAFGILYSIVRPFDQYKVNGLSYRMRDWYCEAEDPIDFEVKTIVSCEKRDGTASFKSLTESFYIVDSAFEK